MAIPKRKCRECGAVGKWTVYTFWDANPVKNKLIQEYRHKWWVCPACDEKDE